MCFRNKEIQVIRIWNYLEIRSQIKIEVPGRWPTSFTLCSSHFSQAHWALGCCWAQLACSSLAASAPCAPSFQNTPPEGICGPCPLLPVRFYSNVTSLRLYLVTSCNFAAPTHLLCARCWLHCSSYHLSLFFIYLINITCTQLCQSLFWRLTNSHLIL